MKKPAIPALLSSTTRRKAGEVKTGRCIEQLVIFEELDCAAAEGEPVASRIGLTRIRSSAIVPAREITESTNPWQSVVAFGCELD